MSVFYSRSISKHFVRKIDNFFHSLSKKYSRKNLYEWLDSEIEHLNASKEDLAILNVGSGGEIYNHINTIGNCRILQIDNDPARNPDIVTNVCEMPMFDDGTFDAVFMMEVLEHVTEPQNALDEVFRVLKPGGVLVLSVPFIFPLHDEPYDFYRFTKGGLAYLLRRYTVEIIRARNNYLNAILVLVARMVITKKKKDKIRGIGAFILAILFYPILKMIVGSCVSDKATTGYFVKARKAFLN
jgi:ubiquinone/menaquinone biosynthesis C-methylase UbiE